jgi:hypothetical protein
MDDVEMPDPSTDAEAERRPRWSRISTWLGEPPHDPVMVRTASDPDVVVFDTPALGDAYEFRVSIRCEWQLETARDWRGQHAPLPSQIQSLDEARGSVRPRLQDRARQVVRRFPAHRPAAAEQALMQELSDGMEANGLRCHTVACVDVPGEIRGQLQAHWRERMSYELRSDRSEVLIAQVGRLRRVWQEFLLDSLNPQPGPDGKDVTWLVPHALDLAEQPHDIAAKVRGLKKQRTDQATELTHDLSTLLTESKDLDVLEFMLRTDTALRETMKLLGVSLPAPTERSPLHDAQTPAPPS